MRDDHKLALNKIKQQILAFCLRHNYHYDGSSHWTQSHMNWLKALKPEALYEEILDEYLLTYQTLSDKIERMDKRIEELASQDEYKEAVKKLCCFIGVKTHTALSVLTEVGDFKRFASADRFASYLGLVPGEDSSGDDKTRLGITKAGNRHVRLLLTEAAQSYTRGQIGFKSKDLKARQSGNTADVIAYAAFIRNNKATTENILKGLRPFQGSSYLRSNYVGTEQSVIHAFRPVKLTADH